MYSDHSSPSAINVRGGLALLPLLSFLLLFLGAGFYFQYQGVEYAFYQLPAPVAIVPAIILAMAMSRESLTNTIELFAKGAGHSNVMTMCLIFLLAGGFSAVAKATGAVDATIGFGLYLIPEQLLLPGLFLITAFIATAMGTSMGTLAAMAPVGLGLAQATGIEPAFIAGVLVSGAMFGDNLSIISDTTIAATRTQGCEMRDKLKANLKYAVPAALLVVVLLALQSTPVAPAAVTLPNIWLVVPYIAIIAMAIAGVNVFVVLLSGLVLCIGIGAINGYALSHIGTDVYSGFTQMQEVFILAMLLAGLSALMRQQGGLSFLIKLLSSCVSKLKVDKSLGNTLGIAGLISLANLCIANNTVAILVSGEVAKQLAEDGDISAPQSASLLDIFACVVQGLVPYGAQLLLIGASFSLSPLAVVQHVWYCLVLAGVVLISLLIVPMFRAVGQHGLTWQRRSEMDNGG